MRQPILVVMTNVSMGESPPGVYIIAIQQGEYTVRRKIIYQ